MRFYGFEYIGKPKTPSGPHHPTTGRQSIAGELAVFLSRKERDNWAQSKPKRAALTSEEARQHCQGLTLTAYRRLLSQLEEVPSS